MADPTDHDVVIIGAGAAGLAAAAECRAQGMTFRVLEARPRIGGRAVTDHRLGAPADLGASWIHAADKGNPWCDIALALGCGVLRDPHRRRLLVEAGLADADSNRTFAQSRDRLLSLLFRDGADFQGSVADLIPANMPWCTVLRRLLGPWINGIEAEAVDAQDWALAKVGDEWLVPSGYGDLVARFGSSIPVQLECAARSIEINGSHVEITTNRGRLRARHVIVTAPTSLLRAGAIDIRPGLPASHEQALDALPFGHLMKVALRFEGDPFGLGDTCGCLEATDARPPCYFMVRPAGADLVYALIGGEDAWALEKSGEPACIDAALSALIRVFGNDVRSHFRGGLASGWGADPWACGTYSAAKPGCYAARAVLSRPVHERLHFAGEANAPDGWHMTVAGAYLAGRAAARRLAKDLRNVDKAIEPAS